MTGQRPLGSGAVIETDAKISVFIFRAATLGAVVERYRQAWEIEREARDRDLVETIAAKQSMAEHYWQAEYQAHLRYRAAQAVLEAFEDGGG